MAQFRYTGDHTRTFPDFSLEVGPDAVVERDENPDPRWFEAVEAADADAGDTGSITSDPPRRRGAAKEG